MLFQEILQKALKGRKKGCPGCTGHVSPLPLSWLFYVTDFKFSHCHLFLTKCPLLISVVILGHFQVTFFFTWFKMGYYSDYRAFWRLVWAASVRTVSPAGRMISLYLFPTRRHPPQPVHSLPFMEMCWKQVLLKSSLAAAWTVSCFPFLTQ